MTSSAHTISPNHEVEESAVPEQSRPAGLEFKTFALAGNHGGDLLHQSMGLQTKALALAEVTGAVNEPYEYTDDNGVRIGVAESFVAVTGVRDKVGDVIPAGAFARTLAELEPKACLGHDWNRPIGYPETIEEWLPGDPRLPEKKVDGTPWPAHAGVLFARTRYNLETDDGLRAYTDAKFFGPQRTAWSIGYVPHATKTRHGMDPHTNLPTRFLHDPDLFEYSQVLHGAHPMALSQAIKSGEPAGLETKIRYVQDQAYWGYPKGTPIRPGMRPRGRTARRIREQGKVPSPNEGVTTAAPKPGAPIPGRRAKPDKITAAADAEGLFPEGESEGRVRAENPTGKDEKFVAQLAMAVEQATDSTFKDEAEKDRDAAMRNLLREGITPNELREDLGNVADNEFNENGTALEPDDIDDLVEDYTGRYNALAKRQARQRRGQPDEEDVPAEGQPAAPAGQEETPEAAATEEPGEPGGETDAETTTPDGRPLSELDDMAFETELTESRQAMFSLRARRRRAERGGRAPRNDRVTQQIEERSRNAEAENARRFDDNAARQAEFDAGQGQEEGTPEGAVEGGETDAGPTTPEGEAPQIDDFQRRHFERMARDARPLGKMGRELLVNAKPDADGHLAVQDPTGQRIRELQKAGLAFGNADENGSVKLTPIGAQRRRELLEENDGEPTPEGVAEGGVEGGETEEIPGGSPEGEPAEEDTVEDIPGGAVEDEIAGDLPAPGQVPPRAPLNEQGDHYDEAGNLIAGGGRFDDAENAALDALADSDEIALAAALDEMRKSHMVELTMADGTRLRGSDDTASLAAELVDSDPAQARTRIREWATDGNDYHRRDTDSTFAAQVDAYGTLDDDELTAEEARLRDLQTQLSDEGQGPYDSAMWETGVMLRAVDAARAGRDDTGATPEVDSPEQAAIIDADEIADAEEVADAAHGVTEGDDGQFEVDDDVAARQERVAGMLAQSESGAVDFTAREPDQLRVDRADVVAELRLQTHLESRRRRQEAGAPPAEAGAGEQGSAETTDQETRQDTPPKPAVRPGVAGAAEDLADALESGDIEEITRTRARLASSLRRSRSDTEPIKALRALMDGREDPTPQQLRAAADAIRADTRARRNESARNRRTARRFERERLRSLLGQIEAAMVSKGMEFDAVPEDSADYNPDGAGALPGGAGNAAGVWVQKIETIQWSGERHQVSEVSGSHYSASVYAPQNRPASYEWTVIGADGETIAKGDGATPDAEAAQAAVEVALATQAKLGNLPADAHLPTDSIPVDTSARPVAEVSAAMDAIRERLALPDRSLNPITGLPDPMTGPTVATRPPTTRAFDTPEQVRRHLEARAAGLEGNPRASLNALINTVRWDDVQFTPGARFMVVQRAGQKDFELISTTHGVRMSTGTVATGGVWSLGKADTLRAGALFESIRADNGDVIDWLAPQEKIVPAIKEMSFGEHGKGIEGMNRATMTALTQEKMRAGRWSDKLVRQMSTGRWHASNVTNWLRRERSDELSKMLALQLSPRTGTRQDAENRKTLAVLGGAEMLTSMGAPDESAVLLRRRAAELREKYGQDEANTRGAPLLDSLADTQLAMFSPIRSPGDRAYNLRAGERIITPALAGVGDEEGVRSLRALTPMRKEGNYGGSTALVVDEATGAQLEIRIGNSVGGSQKLSVYERGNHQPQYSADLGSSAFAVVGTGEPIPGNRDELRGIANADAAIFGQDVLDAAAEALPETATETAARRGAAPEGGRPPRQGSARAPRRKAPPPTDAAPVAGREHLVAAQMQRRRALLGMDFTLTEEAGPGGFSSLEDVREWARTRVAEFPEVEKSLKNTEAYMLNYLAEGDQFTAAGGGRLSPGGHFIVTKDHLVIHIRTGGAVWGAGSQQEGMIDSTADSAMAVADYLERGRWEGVAIDWSRGAATVKKQATEAMRASTVDLGPHYKPIVSTIAARAAIADLLGNGTKPPKVDDLDAVAHFGAAIPGNATAAPSPDRLAVFDTRMARNRYTALAGKKTQGTAVLDAQPANTKAGATLARRTQAELHVGEVLAFIAPLDAVTRLNRAADAIGGETITDTAGQSFKPAEDLRALAARITDMWNPDKPSALGRLLANDSQGVITVSDSVRVESSPVYGASNGSTEYMAAQLSEQLDQAGRQVTLKRNSEGTLTASFGNITVTPKSGADDQVNIHTDGSISLIWRHPHGRMALRLPSGSWDASGPLSDEEYGQHAARVEAALKEQLGNGNATDIRYTYGGDGVSWTVERAEQHREVMEALWQATETVPRDRRAVIAGGLGGAGKSTVLRGFAGIADGDYFTINPDDVKEEMVRRGMVPDVPGLSPMEASPLVHEESSYIANMLARRAYREGVNVMWDITMSKKSSVDKRITEMREQGYEEIDAVFVDIPVEASVERALARHRRGLERFRAGNGFGGRYVPPALIRANRSSSASSANREAFDALQDQFSAWVVYDNSVVGRDPQWVDGIGRWAK